MGGTHYYIESLLWKVLLDNDPDEKDELLFEQDLKRRQSTTDDCIDDDLLKSTIFDHENTKHLSSDRLHRLLRQVDPEMADALHPNNRRKIIR